MPPVVTVSTDLPIKSSMLLHRQSATVLRRLLAQEEPGAFRDCESQNQPLLLVLWNLPLPPTKPIQLLHCIHFLYPLPPPFLSNQFNLTQRVFKIRHWIGLSLG